MATINGIFSTKLRGKVGDVVYRVNGQTNTVSQKPSTVSNPKSLSQQMQRMYMATAAVAYSQMKAICDHSFESVSGKQGNQAEFLRRNVRFLAGQNSSFNLKGNPYMMPNNLIISKGSLVSLGLESLSPHVNSNIGKDVNTQKPFPYKGYLFKSSTLHKLLNPYGGNTAAAKGGNLHIPTVKEFCDAFGINIGSQITFVLNYVPQNYSTFEFESETQLETRFKYCRIVLKNDYPSVPMFIQSVTEDGTLEANVKMLSFDETVIDKEKSENWDHIRIVFDEENASQYTFGYSTFDLAENNSDVVTVTGNNACGNAIISYKQDSKWLRSSEKLLVWTTDEIGNRDNVVRSYSPNDPKYLNNATPSIHVGKV